VIIGGLQPLDIRHSHKEHEAVGIEGDLFLRVRFGTEAIQQAVQTLRRGRLEWSGELAGWSSAWGMR